MCATFKPASTERIRLKFSTPEVTFGYKPECYPGYDAPVLLSNPDVADDLLPVRAMFGLVPPWAKDAKISRMTYNARSETIAKLPSFKMAWAERHFCLVPVDSFYEPNYESGKPVRWSIHRKDQEPFALAAIWERWKQPDGHWMRSFSLITINATDHPLMNRFHAPEDEKRSVVIVSPESYHAWLGCQSEKEARELLHSFDPAAFTAEASPKPPRTTTAEPA